MRKKQTSADEKLYDWFKQNRNKLVIPSIQRDFVWKPTQIEMLFDSIYRGFFIGMFWLWTPDTKQTKNIEFFEIPCKITKHPALKEKEEMNHPIAIIDGQQRLTALSVGLYGNYQDKILCFNCGHKKDDTACIFAFKNDKDIEHTNWIPVKQIMKQNIQLKKLTNSKTKQENIKNFKNAITEAKFIYHTLEKEKELDEIVDIFRRVNKGGTPLSNSQDLMTRLGELWKDCRKQFRDLQNDLYNTKKITITSDFIVKSALFCTADSTTIKIYFDNRDKQLIDAIKKNWNKIANAIKHMATRIYELGFSDSTITSYNALIPLVYAYYVHKATLKNDDIISNYIYRACLLKVFSKSSDNKLKKAKNMMGKKADLGTLIEKYKASNEHLEEILALPKSKASKLALKLLYGYNNSDRKWHDDHMHPEAAFKTLEEFKTRIKKENSKSLKEVQNTYDTWKNLYNQLPNLQPLPDGPNTSKNKKPLKIWANEKGQSFWDREKFLPANYDLRLSNFENFFYTRKKRMKKILKKELQ